MSAPRADASAAGLHGDASTASGAPRDVTAGLWVWQVAHPNWTPGGGWKRTRPALRALLELPFVHVIVARGEPVHERSAFEQALELPPWTEEGSG